MRKLNKKKGQVWIETVVYTLVALALIGTTLAFVKPKIEEIQDKAIIEKTIESMQEIDAQMLSVVSGASGNTRIVNLGIKKGYFEIDGQGDQIKFLIEDSKYQYSEDGREIKNGNLVIINENKGKLNDISIVVDYSGRYDLTYQEKNEVKSLTSSPTPYRIFLEKKGVVNGNTQVNIDLIS